MTRQHLSAAAPTDLHSLIHWLLLLLVRLLLVQGCVSLHLQWQRRLVCGEEWAPPLLGSHVLSPAQHA
jgi:hypothetical protein